MIDVLEIIRKISEQKKESKVAPDYALFNEVQNEVTKELKQEINRLITDKKLKFHHTLNSFSFEVVEETKTE